MRGRPRGRSSSQVSDWSTAQVDIPALMQGTALALDTSAHQGLFWWLGTDGGTGSFTNPSGTAITLSASTTDGGSGPLSNTTDRATTDWYTTNAAGSWWKVDIGADNAARRLNPTHLSFRQRYNSGSNLLQACTIEGSVDGSSWATLATVTNGQLTETVGAWNDIALTSGTAYRYFRLTMSGTDTNGQNYLTACELELFGILT